MDCGILFLALAIIGLASLLASAAGALAAWLVSRRTVDDRTFEEGGQE